MKKTNYKIKKDGKSLQVLDNGKVVATTINKISFALEAIFVLEGSKSEKWYIERDGMVFEVERGLK